MASVYGGMEALRYLMFCFFLVFFVNEEMVVLYIPPPKKKKKKKKKPSIKMKSSFNKIVRI